MAQQIMTIEKWLSDVYYDEYGTHIWNREDKDGGSQLVAEIRGWGRLQNEFPTLKESEKFQDEVGEFIVQAIREKIARTSSQTEISDEEILKQGNYLFPNLGDIFRKDLWEMGAKWYREQLKSKGNENKSNSSI